MTDMTTPLLAAATAELEDWGSLAEATGEPMQTPAFSGSHLPARRLLVLTG